MPPKKELTPAQLKFSQRTWAIKNSLTSAEKALINYYEAYWFLRKTVPTVDEVVKELRKNYPKIRNTSVNYYLTRAPVIKALDQRGIPFRQHTQDELTDKQIAVAITMANFADTRSNKEKLDELGINSATYFAWLQDPVFQNYTKMLANRAIENIDPVAKVELSKKISEGHWGALKHYSEVTGAFATSEESDLETKVRGSIEVIQTHVKDPQVMLAIASDIQKVMQNRKTKYEIEGDTVQVSHRGQMSEQEAYALSQTSSGDEELDHAKKMLGF